MSTLASRLKSAREAKGWSLRELVRRSGVDISQISKTESGKSAELKSATIAALAQALDVTPAGLRGEEEANDVRPAATKTTPIDTPDGIIEMRLHADILASPLNPRKHFDDAKLAELAENIAGVGLRQNLNARPHPKKPGKVEIAAGERRWRAIGLLIKDGRWPKDRPLAVKVQELDDYQLLEIGAGENIQRDDMHPLEEGAAFAALIDAAKKRGEEKAAEKLAARFGKTERWVELRVALHRKLAEPIKAAFLDGKINLEMARAFTLGDAATQAAFWKANSRYVVAAHHVRHNMTEKMIPVGRAHFDPALYQGEIVVDGDDRFFTDVPQFLDLQSKAVAATIEKLKAKWAWVERADGVHVELYRYGKSKDRKKAGAIVHVRGNHQVEIHTGLLKPRRVTAATRGAQAGLDLAAGGDAPAKAGEPWTLPFLAECKRRKSAAMQDALMGLGAAMAMRLACLALLGGRTALRIEASDPGQNNGALALSVSDALAAVAPKLGLKPIEEVRAFTKCPLTTSGDDAYFGLGGGREIALWKAIEALPEVELQRLFTALIAGRLGTYSDYRPKLADDPVAAAIAASLGVTHGDWPDARAETFIPDDGFLQGYRKPGLVAAMIDSGLYEPDAAPGLEKKSGPALRTTFVEQLSNGSPLLKPDWTLPELRFAAAVPSDADEPEDDEEAEIGDDALPGDGAEQEAA